MDLYTDTPDISDSLNMNLHTDTADTDSLNMYLYTDTADTVGFIKLATYRWRDVRSWYNRIIFI